MSNSPAPERMTKLVQTLVTPTVGEAFSLWASKRGLTVSAAARALIVDALYRELSASPVGPLYSDLPPDAARRIVALLKGHDTP